MRVLAFRHVPFEGIGLIARTLQERNFQVDYADLYRADAALPDVAAYDALIFLGGPMSVNDDLPYLARRWNGSARRWSSAGLFSASAWARS